MSAYLPSHLFRYLAEEIKDHFQGSAGHNVLYGYLRCATKLDSSEVDILDVQMTGTAWKLLPYDPVDLGISDYYTSVVPIAKSVRIMLAYYCAIEGRCYLYLVQRFNMEEVFGWGRAMLLIAVACIMAQMGDLTNLTYFTRPEDLKMRMSIIAASEDPKFIKLLSQKPMVVRCHTDVIALRRILTRDDRQLFELYRERTKNSVGVSMPNGGVFVPPGSKIYRMLHSEN